MKFINTGNRKTLTSGLTMNEYQYNIYSDFLDDSHRNTKYLRDPELCIKYYGIDINKSNNINNTNQNQNQEQELHGFDRVKGTGIVNSFKNFTYKIYEFTPVLEFQPLSYEPSSETSLGTSGTMTIIDLVPLVGDIFTFYSGDSITDKEEIFQVTDVTYNRSSVNKLPIYNISFKSAPILNSSLQNFKISEVSFFFNMLHKFIPGKLFNEFNTLNNTMIIDGYDTRSYYTLDIPDPDLENKKIIPLNYNNLITRINDFLIQGNFGTGINPVIKFSNIKTDISIIQFLYGDIIDNQLNLSNYKFIIYTLKDLYLSYEAFNLPNLLLPLLQEEGLQEDEYLNYLDNLDTNQNINKIPIAFIDKDTLGNYYIFKSDHISFNNYLKIYNLITTCYKIYYTGTDYYPIQPHIINLINQDNPDNGLDQSIFTNKKTETSIIPWNKLNYDIINIIDNTPDILYDYSGEISRSHIKREIIGDLHSHVTSFQYGVQ